MSNKAFDVSMDDDGVHIDQPIDMEGNFVRITVSKDQAQQLGKLLSGLTEKKKVKATLASRFDEFWAKYPPTRRVAKQLCLQKWVTKNFDAIAADKILPALDVQLQSRDWLKDDGKYVPLTTTYLNQERWEQAASEIQPQQKFI